MSVITANRRKVMLAMISLGFICQPLFYGASKTSAAAFLKVPASADALALGGNAVILGNGVGGMIENPAILGLARQHEFQTSYGFYPGNYNFLNAAYGHQGALMNTGVSVTRVAASDFEGRDANGARTSDFSARDMAVSVSAARSFGNLSLGMNAKYITSTLEKESASAMAVDAGLVFMGDSSAAHPCKLGVAVRNLGTQMKYINKSEPLPLMASAALAMNLARSLEAGVNVTNNLTENTFELGFGMRFKAADILSLAGGVSRDLGSAAASDSMPFKLSAGIGFKVSNFMLNYGFVPMGELGNSQQMSVTFKFGGTDGPKKFSGRTGR